VAALACSLGAHKLSHGRVSDSRQYSAFLAEVSELGIDHTLVLETRPAAPPRCVAALHARYEQRASKIVARGAIYAAERLSHLSYRESVNGLRKKFQREQGVRFDAAVMIRPDVEYASPLPPLCGGEKEDNVVHAPAWSSFGGVNDRFLVSGAGRALDHYMGLYSGLCRDGMVTKLPWRWSGKGLNSERIYGWWMKQRESTTTDTDQAGSGGGGGGGEGRFRVSTWMLRDFVFYRTRRNVPLDDERSPDAEFGRGVAGKGWHRRRNPSPTPWANVLDRFNTCVPLLRK